MIELEALENWDETVSLLDAYESLLSPSQQETLRLYFRFNLSLGEIAEDKGVSRPAIADALKKGVEKLHYYESRLGLAHKTRVALEVIDTLNDASSLEEAKGVIPNLKEAFDDGI
jgi:hypothetical protein